MTLFEALMGGAFDRLNWQHSGKFDQNFSKKSNAPGFARRGMGGFGIDRYINLTFWEVRLYCIMKGKHASRQKTNKHNHIKIN